MQEIGNHDAVGRRLHRAAVEAGRLLARAQRALGLLAPVDVLHHHDRSLRRVAGVDRRERHVGPEGRAVGALVLRIGDKGATFLQRRVGLLTVALITFLGRMHQPRGDAEQALRLITDQSRECTVAAHDPPFPDERDADVRAFNERALLCRGAQREDAIGKVVGKL